MGKHGYAERTALCGGRKFTRIRSYAADTMKPFMLHAKRNSDAHYHDYSKRREPRVWSNTLDVAVHGCNTLSEATTEVLPSTGGDKVNF